MAKEKKSTEKKEDIWDQMVANVTEENKEAVIEELEMVIKMLEERDDNNLLVNFKAVLKKIK
jgi:hypothetical protein